MCTCATFVSSVLIFFFKKREFGYEVSVYACMMYVIVLEEEEAISTT